MRVSRAELVDALRPLAALSEHYQDTEDSGPAFVQVGNRAPLKLTGADCHRARRLVETADGPSDLETDLAVARAALTQLRGYGSILRSVMPNAGQTFMDEADKALSRLGAGEVLAMIHAVIADDFDPHFGRCTDEKIEGLRAVFGVSR